MIQYYTHKHKKNNNGEKKTLAVIHCYDTPAPENGRSKSSKCERHSRIHAGGMTTALSTAGSILLPEAPFSTTRVEQLEIHRPGFAW